MKKSQLLLTLLLGLVSSCDSPVGCVDTNCSDYATHEQAQAAYEADPDCHGDLDRAARPVERLDDDRQQQEDEQAGDERQRGAAK